MLAKCCGDTLGEARDPQYRRSICVSFCGIPSTSHNTGFNEKTHWTPKGWTPVPMTLPLQAQAPVAKHTTAESTRGST
ncbi:hypothetical protein J6590_048218 [Homalodisca vitripennis]|nr:hypothetical protein J6590_048218 [Homalodisca vitripennis]